MSFKSQKRMDTVKTSKQAIQALRGLLIKRPDQSPQLLDITDVLGQVYRKLDTAKDPEALINRLVNYIRIKASNGKIIFPTPQESLIGQLAWIGAKAGWNGLYMADFSDKRQFYSLLEPMPIRD